MSVKKQSQVSVLLVYVLTMLISLVVFGAVALLLLDTFVTKPKLAREALASNAGDEDVAADTAVDDYSSARRFSLSAPRVRP